MVDVYRETNDGWVGIRPPAGSFSWVAESDLKLLEAGLAEITGDGVPSRIGSRLGQQRKVAQVRFKKGEVVEVVGQERINEVVWFKVAPPAGEFRWVHTSSIERIGPLASTSDEPTADAEVTPVSATDDGGKPAETKSIPAKEDKTGAESGAPTKDWQAAGTSAPGTVSAPPLAPLSPISSAGGETSPSSPATPDNPVAKSATASATASTAANSTTAAPTSTGTSPASVADRLAAIEVRLSRMAAAPISQWNTEGLTHDIDELLSQAESTADRAAVQATSAKIERFSGLIRQHQQVAGGMMGNAVTGEPRTTGQLADSRHPTADGSKYDATGILRPVVSKRPGAPQFALVDERGQVISFVTSTPDINLQPYVGRRVGVVGNRGYIPEFQRANVTAKRVQPLGDRLIR
jgi:hypothetical protein